MCCHAWLLCAIACGTPTNESAAPNEHEDPAPVQEALPDRVDLVVAADARILDERIRTAARAADPELRARALVSLARLHDPSEPALELARGGLRDTDPTVRRAASLALGALGSEPPELAVRALAGALAVEDDPPTRAAMTRDLGRLATDRAVAAVAPALRAGASEERAAACLALAERGIAGRGVSREIRARIASRLAPEQPEPVRFACAYALGRLPHDGTPDTLRAETVALGLSVGDPSARVRQYAYRALGRAPDADVSVLGHGVEDDDWQVRVQALRSLARVAATRDDGPRAYVGALRQAFEALLDEEGAVREGGPLHVWITATAAAAPIARAGPVHDLAEQLLERLADAPPSRDRGLAHCAAAELVDRSRGWPSRVTDCGGDAIEPWERAVHEASVLASVEGAEPQRLARLRRLMQDAHPRVQQAAISAAARIVHVEANELILEALAVDDAGVRAAALDALGVVAARRPSEAVVPPPLPGAATGEALAAVREATPDDEHETLVTWLAAVEATDARDLVESVEALARHPNRGVRDRARAGLRSWERESIPEDHAAIEDPIAPEAIPDPERRPRVTFRTSRGPVVLELRPDEAPTTVARFLELVSDGFYDGLTFHRVVPAFVVQGGDPRGDGYGGPGWAQRCEDNRLRYDRGTVGMALAGRDTGGSQLFITHGSQPHLEGRYTAFGQVVEGMGHVDALQAGDRIDEATVAQ